jgi:hypothetical protein
MVRGNSHLLTLPNPTMKPHVPDHAPRIESGPRAGVCAGSVRIYFSGTFVSDRLFSPLLLNLVDVVHIVVNVVIDLVANHAGELVSVP